MGGFDSIGGEGKRNKGKIRGRAAPKGYRLGCEIAEMINNDKCLLRCKQVCKMFITFALQNKDMEKWKKNLFLKLKYWRKHRLL